MKHFVKASSATILATGLALSANGVSANEWKGEAELGYIMKSGNSESSTLNSKLKVSKAIDKWKHSGRLEASNSSVTNKKDGKEVTVRSAEKYVAEARTDYKISDRSYVFGLANYQEDKFSSFKYESIISGGYGLKAIKNDTMELDLEAGPGYRVVEDHFGNNEEDAILRLGEKFSWKLSANSQFDQSLTVDYGDSNTISELKAAIKSNIVKDFALKVGYGLKYTDKVAPGTKHADTETTITLVYSF